MGDIENLATVASIARKVVMGNSLCDPANFSANKVEDENFKITRFIGIKGYPASIRAPLKLPAEFLFLCKPCNL